VSALERLHARGRLYACDCSRRELRRAMAIDQSANADERELRYSGRCEARNVPWRDGLGIRVRLSDARERFDDLSHGPVEQQPSAQCGDLLAKDRDGNWTYQFAVTVDDLDQGVTLVVRGDDLLASTGRQIQLARLLGRTVPPRYLHHALVMKSATQKLSKADRDTSVRDMRAAGRSSEEVIGRAMHAAGFIDRVKPMPRDEAERRVADSFVTRDV
jgi:glutamyl-tRNA synthetase/glutamyl-Q tRNA(Asp) synthetase